MLFRSFKLSNAFKTFLKFPAEELGWLSGREYIVKTIVTTETVRAIAERKGVEMYDVYTGFKWIAEVMRRNEGKKQYIGGGEESYGFLC